MEDDVLRISVVYAKDINELVAPQDQVAGPWVRVARNAPDEYAVALTDELEKDLERLGDHERASCKCDFHASACLRRPAFAESTVVAHRSQRRASFRNSRGETMRVLSHGINHVRVRCKPGLFQIRVSVRQQTGIVYAHQPF